jgi:pyruvate kinase
MNWGVIGARFEGELSDEAILAFAIRRTLELGIAEPGDVLVATAGVNRESGSTNMIRVVHVDPDRA